MQIPTHPNLVSLLKTLVEIPTVSSDVVANRTAIAYIDRFLTKRGMHIQRHDFNGRPALVATTYPTKTPKLLLAAHVDVVPGPPGLFKLVEQDGKLYGRGTLDMKCSIAAYLHVIDELQANLQEYDLGIMITADEETGGEEGVQALLRKGYQAEACILPDGGGDWKLEQSAKGLFWFKFTATGKAAHGSRTWLGESAVQKVTLAAQAIEREMFSSQGPETSTFNVGTIHAGKVFNQVPDYCEADIDIRFTSANEEQKIKELVDRVCREHDVQYHTLAWGPAFEVDLGNPFIVAWAKSFERITGTSLQTMRSFAGSDARWLGAKGIPTIVTYPKGKGLHSDEEHIEVQALHQLAGIVRDYVKTVAHTAKPLTHLQ